MSSYSQLYGLPDFVKTSSVISEDDIRGLPQTAFADPLRKLPTHTKAATWCSFLISSAGDIFDPSGKATLNLEKAAAWWGIGEECRKIVENLQKQSEVAPITDADFAIAEEFDGSKVRVLPMRGPGNVKQSAEDLVRSTGKYPYIWRKSAARKLLKRAEELGVAVGVAKLPLEKIAGFGYSAVSHVVHQIRQRQYLVKDAMVRGRLQKLAEVLAPRDQLSVAELEKTAEAIDTLDSMSGLYNHYESVLPPEEVCHSIALSTAQEKRAELVRLTNGVTVNLTELSSMPAEKFAALGEDFVSAIADDNRNVDSEKAAELLPTLPADDASVFVRSME